MGSPKRPRTMYELLPKFEQLEAFLDTIKYGGSLAAAYARKIKNKAYIAQSNYRLQRELGVQLFHPNTSRLTPAGERFALHAKRLLAGRKRLLKEMAKLAAENRLLRSVHLVAPTWMIEDLAADKILLEAHPDLHFSNRTFTQNDFSAWEKYSRLKDRRQEAVLLATDLPLLLRDQAEVIARLPLVPVVASSHFDGRFVGYSEFGYLQGKLQGIGGPWAAYLETPLEVLFACQAGAGVGFLPQAYLDKVGTTWQKPKNLEDFSGTMDIFYIP